MLETVHTREDLLTMVNEAGILPFFKNTVPGWSLEEHIAPEVWFTDTEGPWEWKGQLLAEKTCVYGKFVRNGNAWVSLDLFPELANYRRDGYDFEGLCDEGMVPYRDLQLMTYLQSHAPVLSKTARRECGVSKGYDTCLTRLEMQTFVTNQDFVYSIDKKGRPYGWGNALLTLPEKLYGEDYINSADRHTPQESLQMICSHLHQAFPWIPEMDFLNVLK